MTEEIVVDGVVAQDSTEIANLWQWRELIPEALGKGGGVYKYDVSIPLPQLYDLVVDVNKRLIEAGVVGDTPEYPVIATAGYGHIGDGNLHLNVPVRFYDKKVEKLLVQLKPWLTVMERAVKYPHCLFPKDYSAGVSVVLYQEFSRIKAGARAKQIRATHLAVLGRDAEAVAELRTLSVVANHLREQPFEIAQLVRHA